MKTRMLLPLALVVALAGTVVLPTPAQAQRVGVTIRVAPPAPRIERVVVRPGYTWVGGYWRWNGHRYVWRNGYYARVRPGRTVWVAGHYRAAPGGYVWVPGHWR